jgi:hypothetical protein
MDLKSNWHDAEWLAFQLKSDIFTTLKLLRVLELVL